ncbi:MAG TPA: hypothetical protein VMU06_08855 [Stellaceae bacterium]|nr:hypothetical protein [Stellaceae bacterium]
MHIAVARLWPRWPEDGSLPLGLSCSDEGLLIAGNCRLIYAALDREGRVSYQVRPRDEINALLSSGYGRPIEVGDAYHALERIAGHMTRRDWTCATIGALHLRFPELPDQEAARRVLKADATLKVINPAAFDPSKHPRWPQGSTEGHGGRFRPASGDSDGQLPTDRPPTQKELNRYGRVQSQAAKRQVMAGVKTKQQAVAEFMNATGLTDRIGGWMARQLARFLSRFDSAKSLDELIARAQGTEIDTLGYEKHHIVEEGPNKGIIPDELLQGRENIVLVPYYLHRDISDYYSAKEPALGNMTPRDYLRGKSYAEQYRFGLWVLGKFGVLK